MPSSWLPDDSSTWLDHEEERLACTSGLRRRLAASFDELRDVLAEHGATEAWVFGSMSARRNAKANNLDIAVSGPDNDSWGRMSAALERTAGVSSEVIDLESAPEPLRRRIRSSGVKLL